MIYPFAILLLSVMSIRISALISSNLWDLCVVPSLMKIKIIDKKKHCLLLQDELFPENSVAKKKSNYLRINFPLKRFVLLLSFYRLLLVSVFYPIASVLGFQLR